MRDDASGAQKRLLLGWLALLAPVPLPFNEVLGWPVLAGSTWWAWRCFLRRAARRPAALAADLGA